MILPILWVGSALAIAISALRSRHDERALEFGRGAVGFLYIVAGAGANAYFLLRGDDYHDFASGSYLPFVRETWVDLVVPHHDAWISVLIVFELGVGLLAVAGGRRTQVAYGAAIAFHLALLSFGWAFYLWSVPMVAALVVLLRSERQAHRTPKVLGVLDVVKEPALR